MGPTADTSFRTAISCAEVTLIAGALAFNIICHILHCVISIAFLIRTLIRQQLLFNHLLVLISPVPSVVFDVLEGIQISTPLRRDLLTCLQVLRYLRCHRKVLHRDISSGNVLYVKNSSNRSLLQNTPAQEELCYVKNLLGERYVYIES